MKSTTVSLIVLLLSAGLFRYAAGQTNTRVNQDFSVNPQNPQNTPYICINPLNPDNLIVGAFDLRDGDPQSGYYCSTDGGASWTDGVFSTGGYDYGFDPSQLFKTQLYGLADGVWVDEHGTLYTAGNYLYHYKRGKWDYVRSLPENFLGGDPNNTYRAYLHAVRGNASNDIFIFGESETLIHFNGWSWRRLGPPYSPGSYNFWYNCDVKGNLAVGVGKNINSARIIKLWR